MARERNASIVSGLARGCSMRKVTRTARICNAIRRLSKGHTPPGWTGLSRKPRAQRTLADHPSCVWTGPIGCRDTGTDRRQGAPTCRRQRTDRLVPWAGEQVEQLAVEPIVHHERPRGIRDRRAHQQPWALRFRQPVAPCRRRSTSSPLVLTKKTGPGGGPSCLHQPEALGSRSLDEDAGSVGLVDINGLVERQRAGAFDQSFDQCA